MIDLKSDAYRVEEGIENGLSEFDIFNRPEYYSIHAGDNDIYLRMVRQSDKKSLAVAHFAQMEDGLWSSPRRATYGGFDFFQPDYFLLNDFVGRSLDVLRDRGANAIRITTAPSNHRPEYTSMLTDILIQKGFRISDTVMNYAINVDGRRFENILARNNRKRLNQCQEAKFSFEEEKEEAGQLKVYNAIKKNRESKGYFFSMTWEEVLQMRDTFRNQVLFFSAKDKSEIIAGSIVLRLNSNVLYVLFWGELPGYQNFSPVVLLADGIYDFARTDGYGIIDLGTTPRIDDKPAVGLMKFKSRLGAAEGVKLTFELDLR